MSGRHGCALRLYESLYDPGHGIYPYPPDPLSPHAVYLTPRPPLHPAERGRPTASKSPLHRMERGFRGEVNKATETGSAL